MPWRLRYLTSRRHPLAMTCYVLAGLLGICAVFGLFHTTDLPGVSWVVNWAWKAELLVGGIGGTACLLVKPRPTPKWPDVADLLRLEGIAAFTAGLGFIVYAGAIWDILQMLVVSIPLLFLLGLGLLCRAGQAIRESKQAEMLAAYTDAVRAQLNDIETAADTLAPMHRETPEHRLDTPKE